MLNNYFNFFCCCDLAACQSDKVTDGSFSQCTPLVCKDYWRTRDWNTWSATARDNPFLRYSDVQFQFHFDTSGLQFAMCTNDENTMGFACMGNGICHEQFTAFVFFLVWLKTKQIPAETIYNVVPQDDSPFCTSVSQ